MIVTIICDVLGKENNGTSIACMNLVRYLKSKGDEVRIVCSDKDKIGLEGYYIVPSLYLGYIIKKVLEKNQVALAKKDKKIISKALDGADICHLLIPFALSRCAIKICKEKNIPITASFHCQAENFTSHIFMKNNKLANKIVYHNFYNHVYKYVDAIHYPTEFIKNVFENEIKVKTNSYVISNGVNDIYRKQTIIDRDDYLKNKFNIIFVGRFSKEKSHIILLKAINYLKYKDNIRLIFAGCGPLEKKIQKYAKKHNIDVIMNFFQRTELVKIINSSDLYCHPAEIEIESIACLEAISCGLVPIVSDSNRSATKNFALHKTNLFKCNDYKDLAKKIEYWYENPDKKAECSKEYESFSNNFKQETCMEKTRNMLVEVLKKHE